MKWIFTVKEILLAAALFIFCSNSYAAYLQTIQLVNLLANTTVTTGMTPTAVTIQFYDDNSGKACWTTTLNYLADFTIHSGAGQSCATAITHLAVTPILVATVLQTYTGPYTVNIDGAKFATQITLIQATAPVFNTANGLVTTPGTIGSEVQDQFFAAK